MNITRKLVVATISLSLVISATLRAKQVELHFDKGEVLSLQSSINQPDNLEAKRKYFAAVFPIASKLGVQFLGVFNVEEQLAGSQEFPKFGIAKMPNLQMKEELHTTYLPQWVHERENKPDIWIEQVQRDFEMKTATKFTFDSDKYYQVESFWLQEDKADEFADYRSTRQSLQYQYKGSVFFEAGLPNKYETLSTERAPSHTVITEWESKEQFEVYNQLPQTKPFKYLAGYNAWLMTIIVAG